MTKLEQKFHDRQRELLPNGLEWDYRREQVYVPESAHELTAQDNYTKARLEYLKQRFNMDGLQLQGFAKREEPDAEEVINSVYRERARQDQERLTAKAAHYKGKKFAVWYTVSR